MYTFKVLFTLRVAKKASVSKKQNKKYDVYKNNIFYHLETLALTMLVLTTALAEETALA